MYGPVIDPSGSVCGVLSLEVIQHTLHEPPEDVPSGADAALAAEETSPAAAPAEQSQN